MTRVRNPLNSQSATGHVGKRLYFVDRKAGAVVRKRKSAGSALSIQQRRQASLTSAMGAYWRKSAFFGTAARGAYQSQLGDQSRRDNLFWADAMLMTWTDTPDILVWR